MYKYSNKFLTGNKDVDRMILQKLSDRDILIACQSNNYTHKKICDETFFRNLVCSRYPETIKYKDYVKVRDWKIFYLSVIYYIDKLNKEYNFIYSEEKKEKDTSPELEYLSRKMSSPFFSLEDRLTAASQNGYLPVVDFLIEKGANIQYNDNAGLRLASENGHLSVVKFLTERGANIRANNDDSLVGACYNGHLPVVKYLTEHGANIDSQGSASLIFAGYNGHLLIVKYLVEHKAKIHGDYDYALRWARNNVNLSVFIYLQSLK